MRYKNLFLAFVLSLMLFLPGCEAIVGIFQAGFWTAIILVLLIVGLVFYGFKKMSGK